MVIVKINEEPFAKALQFLINYLDCNVRTEKADEISVELKNGVVITSPASISRYLARVNGKLYGSNDFERSLIDHWMDFSTLYLPNKDQLDWNLKYLNNMLSMATYLVGDILSLADVFMAVALRVHSEFQSLLKENKAPAHIARYYKLLDEKVPIELNVLAPPAAVVASSNAAAPAQDGKKERKAEGKFVSLPGAEMGKVVVRFPPEASGYLHAGHAKASLLNQYYQQMFDGKLILRFDDTNPEKEDADFEKVILEDVALLGIKPDRFTRTSDHFDVIIDLCTKMIKNGQAYADDTDPETMKKEREERVESKNRNNDVAKNLSMWNEMQQGTEYGKKCCIRAKLDMNSDNGCLRDPTMYRCKVEEHVATGNKYKVYPTYDFACPVVDSLEGVTHALRTMEYHDRDEQYYWFIDALGIRKPFIWEFSRLNLMNTVMSKRKLTWLVNEKIVDGWDDPRLPTVRGVMRRGMTVEGLKEFVIAQGSSRTAATMEWDKIWAFNKKVIDPIAPRYVALQKDSVVPVFVRDAVKESKEIPKHPKEESVGLKTVWYSDKVFIEGADAAELMPNEVVTFINWGNLVIEEIKKNGEGKIVSVHARLNLDNKDFKKTQKLTWLPEVEEAQLVPTVCCSFDHIITKPVLGKDEDFKQYINRNSKTELVMLGDPELAKLKKGDIIQLQRRGFFICDSPYEYSRESPCVLFNIPDGHVKEMPVAGSKFKATNGEAKETKEVEARQSMRKKEPKQSAPKKEESKQSAPKKEESKQANSQKEASVLDEEILKEGDAIRQLKELLESKIGSLNSLKQQYKNVAGLEWKPSNTPAVQKEEPKQAKSNDLDGEITKQGEIVRQLKAAKVSKEELKPQIDKLLSLKNQFKEKTGQEWKPGNAVQKEEPKPSVTKVEEPKQANSNDHLDGEIKKQGEIVRQLKAAKVSKEELMLQIEKLLALKNQFKEKTGQEWKPGNAPAVQKEEPKPSVTKVEEPKQANSNDHLDGEIKKQGEIVRQLKAAKVSKEELMPQIEKLLALKNQFKEGTGQEWKPGNAPAVQKEVVEEVKKVEPVKQKNKKEEKKSEPKVETSDANGKSREVKKVTRTGMEVKKDENFSEWFSQVITKSDMIEYYNISGCYILNPWAYGIWEVISNWFNGEIQKIGFKNCYFPMFVSHSALETEKQHIADFAPEVAWVTKSGETDLAEPIAIRPTSETVMYPSFAKKVQSHKDLPIKINQWCNVVRWEFKHPQPFLRTREFLWQEGHSAHMNYKEAEEEVYYILDLYSKVYHDLLAVPVIKGRKTEKEKFAGGDYTTTIEAYIPASGRGIQAATSHHLGQNFAKMFDISFQDPESGEKRHAFQNSWGLTTRSIGVAVMVHGDDKGLVLPPRVASIQVIIVPCGITAQLAAEDRQKLLDECKSVASKLVEAGIKAECDLSDDYSPGWKFNKWELKGVPVRVELGPKDLKAGQFVAVRRDTGVKMSLKLSEVESTVGDLLKDIHNCMFEKAKKELDANVVVCNNFNDFLSNLDCNRLLLAPFCGEIACEEDIKKSSTKESSGDGTAVMGAKGLCIPFDQPAPIKEGDKCIGGCSHAPRYYTLFGRSY